MADATHNGEPTQDVSVYDVGRCPGITDYDDSIGGEGEIFCGAVLMGDALTAECLRGHRWVACACGGATCKGWKVAPQTGGSAR